MVSEKLKNLLGENGEQWLDIVNLKLEGRTPRGVIDNSDEGWRVEQIVDEACFYAEGIALLYGVRERFGGVQYFKEVWEAFDRVIQDREANILKIIGLVL